MKVGLFGGSFDPIHRGHVAPVLAAIDQLALDRVFYLPTACPPHKPEREFVAAERRLVMVELALLDEEVLHVDARELTPERPAYTIETLESFRAESPADDLYLLIGADSFAELHTWRRWWELAGLASIAVMARPGWTPDAPDSLEPEVRGLLDSESVHLLETPFVDASSSAIRSRLAAGEAMPSGVVDSKVLEYIRKYDLYR